MGYFQVILAEFRSGRVKTGHVKRLLTFHLVRLGNISSLVTLTFPYTPLVEVKQAQNTWSYRQISKFSTTWKYSQSGHTNISIHTSCRSETSSKCLVVLDKYQNQSHSKLMFWLGESDSNRVCKQCDETSSKSCDLSVTCHTSVEIHCFILVNVTWGSSVWRCECDQYWKYFQVVLNEMSDVSKSLVMT